MSDRTSISSSYIKQNDNGIAKYKKNLYFVPKNMGQQKKHGTHLNHCNIDTYLSIVPCPYFCKKSL
jgi:hypothetical protein